MKILFRLTLCFLIFLTILACQEPQTTRHGRTDYSKVKNQSRDKAPAHEQLPLDTIRIFTGDESSLCSMVGFFAIKKDTLCFIDQKNTAIFYYDNNGKFLKKVLSKGRGPHEVLSIDHLCFYGDQCYTIDGNWILTTFNNAWDKTRETRFNWSGNLPEKTLMQIQHPDSSAIYEMEYEGSALINAFKPDKVLIPITTEHPKLNGFFKHTAENFYQNCFSLGIVDARNGKLEKKICNWPPVYTQYRYIPNFRHILYDVNENILIYSFMADSLIYQMDLNTFQVISSFGIAGRNMKTDYRTTTSFDEADGLWVEDLAKYGYYNRLKYANHFLFRNYKKGEHTPNHGLQVYRKNVLIHDFEVPGDFRIIGYSKPFYFAYGGYNNDTEEMTIYRFSADAL